MMSAKECLPAGRLLMLSEVKVVDIPELVTSMTGTWAVTSTVSASVAGLMDISKETVALIVTLMSFLSTV